MAPLLKNAVTNIPTLTKSLLFTLLIFSGMGFIYIYQQQQQEQQEMEGKILYHCPFIGIVPGLLISAPWTFITSIFYENTIFTFLFSFVVLLLCGKYLERIWGSRELLKFILITGIISNLITWFGLVLSFYLSGDDTYLYKVQINGLPGVFSAFLVAFKYLIPEHRLAILGGMVSIRVKNLIGVATFISIVCLIFFKAIVLYNLVNIGWVVGWVYIRFFRVQDGIQGDRSEAFALVTFFPEFLHPIIRFISNIVFNIFVKLRIIPSTNHRSNTYDLEGQLGRNNNSGSSLPGSARAEAERRRALALKALDMRLSKPSTIPSSSINTVTPVTNNASSSSSTALDTLNPSTSKEDILFDASKEIEKNDN
ncbi:eukaryotic integral membrane protein-domain-containing protein [Cunninghamella echinulata]|nr:eukaryotic integral membrane protein-domain-containing protein [Cunninghamella echinulata]